MKLKEKALTFLETTVVGKALSSAAIGSVSAIPFVGTGIATELKSNKLDKLTGEGKMNYIRLAAYGVMSLLIIGRIVKPDVVNIELIESISRILLRLAN